MSNCSFVTFTQNIENQEITSAKYTVLMLYVCQNERKKAFGRSPPYHNTRSKDVQRLERWFDQTGISFDAQDRSTYGNKTIKLHSRTDVSGLSMQLDATLLNVSYHTIKKTNRSNGMCFYFYFESLLVPTLPVKHTMMQLFLSLFHFSFMTYIHKY